MCVCLCTCVKKKLPVLFFDIYICDYIQGPVSYTLAIPSYKYAQGFYVFITDFHVLNIRINVLLKLSFPGFVHII